MKKCKWVLSIVLPLITIIFIINPVTVTAQTGKPITLNFVSFAPAANVVEFQHIKKEFFDRVNQIAKGRLVINVKGGPEVIPPFNLGIAVKNGTIDMACIPNAFFEDLVPGIGVTHLSPFSAAEERKNGVYEAINELYRKAGLFYLGRGEATEHGYFIMFLNKPVEKPADFKGLRLGGTTSFHGQYRELGAVASTLQTTEYNTAMERGTVDGLSTSLYIAMAYGLQGVTKYVIQPGFWRSSVAIPINLAKWNTIPSDLQKLLIHEMAAYEAKFAPYELEQRNAFLKKFTGAGPKIINLAPDVAKWFVDASTEGAWKYAEERQPGEAMAKMKQLLKQKQR
ncbi:MAG: TRAP transporter substrate-binding protein DctP [Syntrophorhabdaceae bacterium]|nr:TRAP transporter substrate-binding protein DctP [Syntrophorhabdaceae bacterium]